MAYRFEKNGGIRHIVIDGWENGIADSPYNGIANMRNLNIEYYKGVAYVNYKRQPATITGGTLGRPLWATQSPAGIIYISDDTQQIFKQTAVNGSTFALLTGNAAANINGIQFWNNYLIVFGAPAGNIEICGDGSGDSGVTSSNWNTAGAATGVWPIKSSVSVTLSGTPSAGSTGSTQTIVSYTDAQGTSRAFWNGPTGVYTAVIANQTVTINLIQGSDTVAWTPALNNNAGGANITVNALATNQISAGNHMSLISINDGNLYFCNGSNIGAFLLNNNQVFAKGNMKTFTFNANILSLPPTDGAVWLTELRNNLLIAGQYHVYTWDFFDPFTSPNVPPIPINESISKMINIMNNVFIFAGNKGNIYYTAGTTIQGFKKIPDYLTSLGGTSGTGNSLVDPAWNIGGIMQHRQKLVFQAFAQNSVNGNPIFQGILSLDINLSAYGLLQGGAINVENQNSFGVVQSSSESTGVLIDNNNITSLNYDNYYSAYKANAGGIDFNNTNLYSSNEALIETDLIPVGTFLDPDVSSSIEFKLDQPLLSGDSITVYARASLSNSYVPVNTIATSTISGPVVSGISMGVNFQRTQWIQLLITMSCNTSATTSSFIRIREIRIRQGEK